MTDLENKEQAVLPEDITLDFITPDKDETYYTSPGLSLMVEVNGAFFEMEYFTLDKNLRVYDDIYLYEGDYFYMITADYDDIYASLSDPSDASYAEEEREQGYDIQINVTKAGIYKLIFNVDTLKFDMEYKAEIDTPRYYTIKNCQVYTTATEWVDMSASSENPDEFVIKNFNIGAGEYISFHSTSHTSLYKITLDGDTDGRLASYVYPSVTVYFGGRYDIYINSKTYVVRLVLLNPDTATYSCVYYDGENFVELQPYDGDVPYVFCKQIIVDTKYTTSLPKFYSSKYKTYSLTVVDTTDVLMGSGENYYFKNPGTYNLIINLKTFEISAELLPE